ncbi:pentapeptide repeat-containing protein [Myxococcota bacterium]|nr:pentapeptide repeat-containing protein [Myxococcota bacterium]MBU1381622.1 pentapeptide repeat-containing protein [Myxococcota bacterium]MBU1496834.1 pentapeptide repeat-containing protein [Myxococcota bacterium]
MTDPKKEHADKLLSRWKVKNPETGKPEWQETYDFLKSSCNYGNSQRPAAMDLRQIPLVNLDLSELDLSNYDLTGANLNRSDLSGSNLSYTRLNHAHLEMATLNRTEFLGATARHAIFNECSGTNAGFAGADFSHSSFIGAKLVNSSFSSSILHKSDLRALHAKECRFAQTDLSGALLTRANVAGSDFKLADVKNTSFEMADMQRCRLITLKNYRQANWIGADIRDMDLRGAFLIRRFIADENYLYEFRTKSSWHEFIYKVWKISSDCGRSLIRWFTWMLVITVIFALVYTIVDIDFGIYETPISPLYFSVVTVTTLGYGDAVPMSQAAQIWVVIQAITGYMGLGGLLSILGNKMSRRAE